MGLVSRTSSLLDSPPVVKNPSLREGMGIWPKNPKFIQWGIEHSIWWHQGRWSTDLALCISMLVNPAMWNRWWCVSLRPETSKSLKKQNKHLEYQPFVDYFPNEKPSVFYHLFVNVIPRVGCLSRPLEGKHHLYLFYLPAVRQQSLWFWSLAPWSWNTQICGLKDLPIVDTFGTRLETWSVSVVFVHEVFLATQVQPSSEPALLCC